MVNAAACGSGRYIVVEATFTNPVDGEPTLAHVRWALESAKAPIIDSPGYRAIVGSVGRWGYAGLPTLDMIGIRASALERTLDAAGQGRRRYRSGCHRPSIHVHYSAQHVWHCSGVW